MDSTRRCLEGSDPLQVVGCCWQIALEGKPFSKVDLIAAWVRLGDLGD